MSSREHWDTVYTTKGADHVSWFRPHLDRSLAFLEAANVSRAGGVIDVGGGASTFVDDLLDRGYTNITVLDLSRAPWTRPEIALASALAWFNGSALTSRIPSCRLGSTISGTIVPCFTSSAIPWRAGATWPRCVGRSSRVAISSWRRLGLTALRSAAVSRSCALRRRHSMPNSDLSLRGSRSRRRCTQRPGALSKSSSTVIAGCPSEDGA
jgi:hypothetical protein